MAVDEVPNRSLFKAPEVCQLADLQPYVLRSWESEFPDLGVARREGGSRLYRRADVERVLQIKQLVFVEGLTLSGARRRLGEPQAQEADGPPIDELLGRDARERLLQVRDGLREVLQLLSVRPGGPDDGAGLPSRGTKRGTAGRAAGRGQGKKAVSRRRK